MGDRTHVTLTVRKKDYERIKSQEWFETPEDIWGALDGYDDEFIDLYYAECNYGDLDFEDEMIAAGIPFDKEWGHGGDYNAGVVYLRFNEAGETAAVSYEHGDEKIPSDSLIPLLDKHEELVKFITDFHSRFTVLPWEGQDENANKYRAKQLLLGK